MVLQIHQQKYQDIPELSKCSETAQWRKCRLEEICFEPRSENTEKSIKIVQNTPTRERIQPAESQKISLNKIQFQPTIRWLGLKLIQNNFLRQILNKILAYISYHKQSVVRL